MSAAALRDPRPTSFAELAGQSYRAPVAAGDLHFDNVRPLNTSEIPSHSLHDDRSEGRDMSLDAKPVMIPDRRAGKSLAARGTNLPPIMTMGQAELTEALCGAIRQAFERQDSPAKRLMQAVNSNEKASKQWFGGNNCPNALYLLRMIATVPEVQAEVRRLCAMESDLDPMLERDVTALWTRVMRMKGAAE